MNIVEKINQISKLYKKDGCSENDVIEAEKKLGVTFSADYKEYVKEFGKISFYGTELTGVNVPPRLDVVNVTLEERKLSSNFPKEGFYVIENLGIDSKIAISNEKGEVYIWTPSSMEKLCDSFSEYIDICIKRMN